MVAIVHKDLTLGLGAAIRSRRKAKGWTLGRLSKLASVSLSFLSQVEGGVTEPSLEYICRICVALDLTVSQLFQLAEVHSRVPHMEREVLQPSDPPKKPKG